MLYVILFVLLIVVLLYASIPPGKPGQSTWNKNVGDNIVSLLHIFTFHTMPKITRNLLHISNNLHLLSFWELRPPDHLWTSTFGLRSRP